MREIKVNLKERSYKIFIGAGILQELKRILKPLKLGDTAYIITNNTIKNAYGSYLQKALRQAGFNAVFKTVADSEKSKSLKTASAVIEDIAKYETKSRIFIIAFGGGVIGDLAGFVASIYKRGINYIHIPTTLLAQVDSSIGGKTAVDLSQGKNLIGAFYQPRMVIIDINLLRSLSNKEISGGLAEIIKYGAIKDKPLFQYLEKNHAKVIAKDKKALEYIIYRCCSIKARITAKDEKEKKGLRTILNFGHTIAHAIEAAGGYEKYTHGQAVAIGMLAACQISIMLKLAKKEIFCRMEKLIRACGLPLKTKGIPSQKVFQAHLLDKKFEGAKNRFVLIEDIGRVKIIENIPAAVIKAAIKNRLN